jgi:hypothetical protein
MKLVSKIALGAALALGAPLFAAAPAFAKDEKAPQLKVSAEFRKAIAAADVALKAKDAAGAETQVAAAEAVSTNDDEKFWSAKLRYDLELLKANVPGQIKALDALIASPKTDPDTLKSVYFLRGRLANQTKKFAEAIPFLTKARELGATQVDLTLQLAIAYLESGNVQGGVAEIEKAIAGEQAAGRKAPEEWYKFAVSKLYHSGAKVEAANWLTRQVAAYPSAESWRSTLLIYMENTAAKGTVLDRDQKLDIYRLMRVTKSLAGESDYYEYAFAAQQRGLPWESTAVIDEGRAAGKAPAIRFNQLYTSSQTMAKNEGPLSGFEAKAKTAPNGKSAAGTGDAYLASGNYVKAVELYTLALQKGGVPADEVNTRLGIALALSGQKPAAKQAFAAVTGAPRADIAKFWTIWIDQGSAAAPAAASN